MSLGEKLPVFDCDQHYYEPTDAFTRHLPKEWRERAIQEATINGRTRLIVGGKVDMSVSNPTWNPIVKPGVMQEYFRGNPSGRQLSEYLAQREPLPDSHWDRDARILKMNEQELEKVWMLPSSGMAYEEGLQFDVPACVQAFKSFNRYLDESWGFAYQDRIFTAPYLYFGDVDAAVSEIEWGLSRGARIFVVRPNATYTEDGWLSPGDEAFDPIWARLNESGATLVPHVAEIGGVGLDKYVSHQGNIIGGHAPPLEVAVGHDRAIGNYLGALTCDKVFERFPGVRVASVENGADFLPLLLAGLKRASFQRPGYFASDPVQQFRDHVWVAPFWEDDLHEVVAMLGTEHVCFGSDYPHPEGLAEPREYEKLAAELGDEAGARRIMYENTLALTTLY